MNSLTKLHQRITQRNLDVLLTKIETRILITENINANINQLIKNHKGA
nr:hypothetical protein [Moritella viscosa]SHO03628.1 unnamed protein product [Moritella viscosa]